MNEWPHGAILEGRDSDGAIVFVAWTPTEAAAAPVWEWMQEGDTFEYVCMRPADEADKPDLDRYWETKEGVTTT